MSSPEAPSRPAILGRFFWRDPNTQFLILAAAAAAVALVGAGKFSADRALFGRADSKLRVLA